MPIFSRRRLKSMLDELLPYLDVPKTNDFVSRLESRKTAAALAAEAELSLVWAISKVAHLTVEPELPNSFSRPDALSSDLFASGPAVIEIRAMSDDSFSGKEDMDRTANIISGYADHLRRGAGKHLYFEFMERSYWTDRYHRERCVDRSFALTPAIKAYLREWITTEDWPAPQQIRIAEGKTDVVISWRSSTSPNFRTHCSMPPVAYDLEDNPIYRALEKKAKQVKGAEPGTLRCVFLVDAGCYLLQQLKRFGRVWEVSGEAIIEHAIQRRSIDMVCVFSPYRHRPIWTVYDSTILWKVTCFDSRNNVAAHEYARLDELAKCLPAPRFEGYQARERHRAGDFDPAARGWYLPTHMMSFNGGAMTIKVSSRLVLEYLAGRLDASQFRQAAFGEEMNIFEAELSRGNTIRDARFESGGTDEDDDYLVFEVDFDWSANTIKQA